MNIEKTIKHESNVIADKFFSDIAMTSSFERVDSKRYVKGEILLNGEPYHLYSYDIIAGVGVFDYLLIPKDFNFNNSDCGDIYRLSTYTSGYHCEKISFKGDTFCQIIYDLISDKKFDREELTLNKHVKKYTYDKSVFSKLLKYLESSEAFYQGYLRVPDNQYTNNTSYDLVTVTKSNGGIRGKVIDMTDSITSLKRLMDDTDYEVIDGDHSTLLNIVDSLDLRKEKINQ